MAWCSNNTNKIEVVDFETNKPYASFDGVHVTINLVEFRSSYYFKTGKTIIFLDYSWTHVKEIANTKLLVSLYHNRTESANMAVFDLSKQGQVNEIYSLGEVSGRILTCFYLLRENNSIFPLGPDAGDVTYNSRRGILGAISVEDQIAYHLFNINVNASETENIVKFYRKSKRHTQSSNATCN